LSETIGQLVGAVDNKVELIGQVLEPIGCEDVTPTRFSIIDPLLR